MIRTLLATTDTPQTYEAPVSDFWLVLAGVGILIIGLIISIALHELGHLIPAKLFNIRVTQYMVGFGKTLWSKKKGETEYGIKAIPLGGYIAMIGMYPPLSKEEYEARKAKQKAEEAKLDQKERTQSLHAAPNADNTQAIDNTADNSTQGHTSPDNNMGAEGSIDGEYSEDNGYVIAHSTGLLDQMSKEAREVETERLQPGDENRMFYKLPMWKKLVVMGSGPLMNLVIAVVIMGTLIQFYGVNEPTTEIRQIHECVVVTETDFDDSPVPDECTDSMMQTPAMAAGLEPGDNLISIAGVEAEDFDEVRRLARENVGQEVPLEYERNGETHSTTVEPIEAIVPQRDNADREVRNAWGELQLERQGYIGISVGEERVNKPFYEAVPMMYDNTVAIAKMIPSLPVRVYDIGHRTIVGEERAEGGPVSIVGVGRFGGEIATYDQAPLEDRFVSIVSMLASVNIALFVFNSMIPLLPLDSGHMAGAIYEKLRRLWAKLLGRPDPGPVDISRWLIATYIMGSLLLLMGGTLILADIFNPVRLLD